MWAPASYIEHAATQQLFVCYGDGALGKPFSKQRLTHWLCEGISHAYELTDLDPWSHLSALYPFLEVLFSEASVEDACLKSVLTFPFDLLLSIMNGSFGDQRSVLTLWSFRIYCPGILTELLKGYWWSDVGPSRVHDV